MEDITVIALFLLFLLIPLECALIFRLFGPPYFFWLPLFFFVSAIVTLSLLEFYAPLL